MDTAAWIGFLIWLAINVVNAVTPHWETCTTLWARLALVFTESVSILRSAGDRVQGPFRFLKLPGLESLLPIALSVALLGCGASSTSVSSAIERTVAIAVKAQLAACVTLGNICKVRGDVACKELDVCKKAAEAVISEARTLAEVIQ